ncbi:anaerobic sulfatase maturase [Niameybacter massiliensis]|uniref:Anaerobic sulfatase maturase n=1 Tax=Holtiella tumoricola TaxID=3018743 RepID=A0AA42J2N3_9FIRM|nr:anaerobic sulfatase maturase [Holtiella tumoricola]MDA3733276.1 anaerobic sulfatase maturase [Holtiella tumoricola]
MPPIHLLIKPASSGCNLACKYCFYYDVSDNRQVKSYGRMTKENLEVLVEKAMTHAEGSCTFAFQGGEPTLVGLDFYEALIAYEKKYARPGLQVSNAIQTNGTLIDEEWAKFFAKNKFLVGLSLDGIKDVHNELRLDRNREGTFERVLETTKLFDKYKVEYNILTVVTRQVAENIKEIYDFYIANNFRYMQFIPCLDEIHEEKGQKDYSLTPRLYEKFLMDLFDKWYETIKKGEFIYIRYFENLLQVMLGYYPEACGMMGTCTYQYVIEADGGVYPCDFYVMDEYKIGNMLHDDFKSIEAKRTQIRFIEQSQCKDSGCLKCKWYNMCHGGCRRDRDKFEDGKMGRNYFCTSYKTFFKYSYPRLQEIGQMILKRR